MAQAIPSGSKRLTEVNEGTAGRSRTVMVTVGAEETPGFYRCQTDMGIALLVPEASLVTP